MRPDQIAKLEDIAERLADVFIVEADPANWSGAGKLPSELTRDMRGDRHWDRRGAVGTAACINQTLNLLRHWRERAAMSPGGALPEDEEEMLDKTIRSAEERAEKAAAAAVDRAKARAKKPSGERISKP